MDISQRTKDFCKQLTNDTQLKNVFIIFFQGSGMEGGGASKQIGKRDCVSLSWVGVVTGIQLLQCLNVSL